MYLEIVVPHFGDLDYLNKLIDSVKKQTNQNWHLTIVSDGGCDESEIRKLIDTKKESRIDLVINESTLGLNGNFSKCLRLVQADFFCMPGSDDLLRPNFVEVVLRIIEAHPEVSILQPGVSVIDERGELYSTFADNVKKLLTPRVRGSAYIGDRSTVTRLMLGNWMYYPSIIWRTQSVREFGFHEEFRIALDFHLILQCVLSGKPVYVTDEKIFLYRRHKRSASMSSDASRQRYVEEILTVNSVSQELKLRRWFLAWIFSRLSPTIRGNYILREITNIR